MTQKLLIAVALCALSATASDAQSVNQTVLPPVRVQSSIQIFARGPVGDGEAAIKARDNARRSVYEMAGRECEMLREVLAKECKLESISVRINSLHRQVGQDGGGFNVVGTMSSKITLK